MHSFRSLKLIVVTILALSGFSLKEIQAETVADARVIASSVARLLQQGHYSHRKIDQKTGQQALMTYIEALDYNKLFFTQKDIDAIMAKYGDQFGAYLLDGNLSPAYEIFDLYKDRVQKRVQAVPALTAKDYTFDTDEKIVLNRQKQPWAADEKEADQLWLERVKGGLLEEKLNEHAVDPPAKVINRRYDRLLRNVEEMDNEDITKLALAALAQTFDPHSDYMSASDLENFAIQMRLSLVGVGAVLRSDDGYARVMEVVPGGPADLDGRLKVKDRIAAVAQGNDEFEDVVDMKLDKVVEKIRGKKGTIVRLQVIPGDSADPSKRSIIEITRDEVKLKDQEAKAEVIDYPLPNGRTVRLGWITLPSFYAEMMNRRGEKSTSTTKDVSALLQRLKKEGIEGLVMDLRKDGGGSLEEAIQLTGLFIPGGPVVQAKDAEGRITVSEDTDPRVMYSGPMVVLTNRLSASASEIFAAALQDYGRAVIVGDTCTFGKGTVQTVIEIGKLMPFFSLGASGAGALKLTIQKFYRVKGGSTQQQGVLSDIILPSLTDTPEIGESALKYPLPYDEVPSLKIAPFGGVGRFLDILKERSQMRVATNPEFAYIKEDADRLTQKIADNNVSLNEKQRKKELQDDKARKELRKKEREVRKDTYWEAYALTLDDVDSPKLLPVSHVKKEKSFLSGGTFSEEDPDASADKNAESEEDLPDPIRREALHVLYDLVELSGLPRTASASVDTETKAGSNDSKK